MKRTDRRRYQPKRRKVKRRKAGLIKPKWRLRLNWEYLPVVAKWVFEIAVVCLFAFVAVWYFGQRVSTVGDSMSPVLRNGDVVLVNRIVYNATTPKRGDVIVFKPKGNENDHYYIKRIVGLPGETIEIIENRVYIDGERLEEDYETTNIDDVGVVDEKLKLAGDEYFVLGDNREQSEDSRDADVGNVKREYIYGKAWFVITPGDEFGFVN
ncbi:signal peptidase I [Mordavella massiliensis]|jgi:signal peptidase I|uniref:Signal peptidase I n=1 Tax=Mordavella massiliensis TaxID=1871024 RepID=A0A939BCT0_9CLOT|nr:signal peptidase I [Mordavella massiliensis]MBM6827590.1 signal peptidase I [Mordavella massiliensis]HJB85805.1 signal peptidase I [Candidatus Dorea faecigallinarum]